MSSASQSLFHLQGLANLQIRDEWIMPLDAESSAAAPAG